MSERVRERLTYANVMATLALFVALGGAGYAAVKLPRNSVGPKQIKEDAVKASEQAPNSVAGGNLIDESVGGDDVAEGAIGSSELANGAVGGDDIGDGIIGSSEIANGGVTSEDLGGSSVTASKLNAPASFTTAGLPDAFGTCAGVGDSWGSFSPDVNNSVSYYRDPFGIVHLRGIAVRCGAAGTTILTLPAGYRPDRQQIPTVWSQNTGAWRLSIGGNGAVEPFPAAGVPAGTWISLDSVTFRCGPSGADGCP